MSKEFLGRGWKFPVQVAGGRIALSEYEQDIREAVRVILGTARGERVMRPDFGGGLHDFVFETMNTTTLGSVQKTVFDALVQQEPRIQVINVDARPEGGGSGTLYITVDYRVRATNTQFNMVFPFFLQEKL